MKFLVAIALLALAVAEATHVPEHTLRLPRFQEKRTYKYDTVFNMTAGVLGLSSQVSASVLRAEVWIYAESQTDYVLKVQNVRVSGSVKAIDSKYGDIKMGVDASLEDRLSSPIRFTMKDGNIISYTMARKDNLETKKIKRSILRSLEMHVPDDILRRMESPEYTDEPIMWNITDNTDYGVHISNYIITASPDIEYPAETSVYNISRIDNCEGEWYPGYKLHHNFQRQGCPEVCRKCGGWKDNQYGTGCPSGFEPHHSPIKRSFSHEYTMSPVGDLLSPEIITTVETHFAKLYDQDMEVLIRYRMKRTEVSDEKIEVEQGQTTYSDLRRFDLEINVDEIDDLCSYKKSSEAVASAKELLKEMATDIIEGSPSSKIGEKVILLRDIFTRFRVPDFEAMTNDITKLNLLEHRPDEKSIERQVWLEMLPLIGTPESVTFIVQYIEKELMKNNNMLVWEAKEMLESLPQNIERPDESTILEMKKLLENGRMLERSTLLHSAVHLAMGRIIGEVCGNVPLLRVEKEDTQSWLNSFQRQRVPDRGLPKCPEATVLGVIETISQKLKRTRRPEEIAIYIEALTHTGMQKALWEVNDYAHGTAKNMQHFSPRHMSFMRSAALFALHNMVERYPEDVMEIVLPIFFNATETPKVRNAAFGVLIRCQPSLAILERVATVSWFEKSREVGSFVTSTLETFGNSSLPCMQLLSSRIKEILPQLKRFDIGHHHAKNYMWSYFDDVRTFSLEGRFEYTPNNESIVPSTLYHALSYTIDSLRDTVFQSSINMEGLTQEKILRQLIKYIDITNIEPIAREDEIFGEGKKGRNFMIPRTVEEFRVITQQKLFYKSSYYYLNLDTYEAAFKEFSEVFKAYLRKTTSTYSGYLVKLFLPSSYHTISVAKTLPYPVEFQMRQPVVFSLGIKTDKESAEAPTLKKFNLHLKPSIYLAKIFTHQMKNLRDCKEIGVYHTHKIGMTYPFQIKYDGRRLPKMEFKYRMPETTPDNVLLYYYTDAGTYAGRKEMKSLAMTKTSEPIRTLPTPFKFVRDVNLVGIPPFRVELHSEDMNLFHQRLPRTPTESLHRAVKNILNAGWRYKSATITILDDSAIKAGNNEVTVKVHYNHRYADPSEIPTPKPGDYCYSEQSQRMFRASHLKDWDYNTPWVSERSRQSEDDDWTTESSRLKQWDDTDYTTESSWRSAKLRQSEDDDWTTESSRLKQWDDTDYTTESSWRSAKFRQSADDDYMKYLKPHERETLEEFERNAKSATYILNCMLPHIRHTLNISISAESLSSNAYILMDYNHTYDKTLHLLHVRAHTKKGERDYEVNLDHIMGYLEKPDELHYDSEYGKQIAAFRTAVGWLEPGESPCTCAWEKSEVAMVGTMKYQSNKYIFEKELLESVGDEHFLPETHEECLQDVRDKNPLSTNCMKAIREHSEFNNIRFFFLWNRDLPQSFKHIAGLTDVYLKHHFFEHLYLTAEDNAPNRIDVEMNYIDKFVDEPVADWIIKKPSETLTLKRIPTYRAQPFSIRAQPYSSIYETHEALLLEMTNNTYPARCVLSENYVHTYDLVTYPFESKRCQYVISSHCTKTKNFAILFEGAKKEIHIYVASDKLVLLPRKGNSRSYSLSYNGNTIKVEAVRPQVFDKINGIYVYVEEYKADSHLRVVAEKAGINVIYDGKTVSIRVSARYKGELCGLCGEFDGEEVREFRGMDRCLYRDPIDFANSAIVQRSGICEVKTHQDERICEDPRFNDWVHHGLVQSSDPSFKRNVVINRNDEVCFSVRPLPACDEDQEPSETETQRIGFHCLPKDDLTAKKLVDEAKWRPLDELKRKSVDYVERIEVAKRC